MAAKNLTDYLAQNPDYINALANLTANYRNKQSQLAFDQNNDQQAYGNTLRGLADTYLKAKQANDNSFAARGLMQSGLFVGANNDLNNAQTEQVSGARVALQQMLNQLGLQGAQATSGYQRGKAQLDTSAASRYAAALGKY